MTETAAAAGVLSGIKVVDFGHFVAGPLTAVMLADQGADVVHVDRPGAGLAQPDVPAVGALVRAAPVAAVRFRRGEPVGLHEGARLADQLEHRVDCLLYTSPSPRDRTRSRMPSSA